MLTATPDAGSTFVGWSGGGCTGTGQCVMNMNANKTVTALFKAGTYTITAQAVQADAFHLRVQFW